MPDSFVFCSSDETIAFAEQFARRLKANDTLLLTGGLGAGKTTFTRGLALGLGSIDLVQSPTYVYLQIYSARLPIFHFDLYRLKGTSDFLSMGFEEYFTKNGIVILEWPERIKEIVPPHSIHIHLESISETGRKITISPSQGEHR